MIRVMVKFKSFPIMIYKTAAAVQKVVRMSTDAVLMCQCFGAEFAVRLRLVQFDDPLLAILETGTMLIFLYKTQSNPIGLQPSPFCRIPKIYTPKL